MNLWQTLEKPLFILAPMEDVTDSVFRRVVIECGRPAVFFTEFTNVDGMFSAGKKQVTQRLHYTDIERPVVAQIWGMNPEHFYMAAKEIDHMGFDGIDINMGCPEKSVVSRGACSALINNKKLASEIIQATIEGAGELPVSVKTRIGFKEIQTEEWISFLLEHDLDALTIHGRTAAELSKVPAHWDEIGKAVKIRDEKWKDKTFFAPPIIGNGDIKSLKEAREMIKRYGVDGIMIGRGIFENVWLFDEHVDPKQKTKAERLHILARHVALYQETWGNEKNYQILKKYFKIYIAGFEGAADMRMQFMATNSCNEALALVKQLTER